MPQRKGKLQKKYRNPSDKEGDDSSVDSCGNIRNLIDYEDEDDDDSDYVPSDESIEATIEKRVVRKAKREHAELKKKQTQLAKKKKSRVIESESESDEAMEEDEDEDEDEDNMDDGENESEADSDSESDSDNESESESESEAEDKNENRRRKSKTKTTIDWLVLGGAPENPNQPKKYKMKKENQAVRHFVDLLQKQTEGEEENIDNDITYFKTLSEEKQNSLLLKLESRLVKAQKTVPLKFQILEKTVPPEVQATALGKFQALCNIDPSSTEYYKCSQWINGYIKLPLGSYKSLPVCLDDGAEKCAEFMSQTQKFMNSAIYGQDESKLQILQFVSAWIANPKSAGNVLSIHGPAGIGKTTLVKEGIAKALGRPFHFISLGGATDASYLDGHSYTYEGSTWGRIADVLMQSQCMNPVIYFDELDKVSDTPKGEEIINLLVHLTDGAQNDKFQDKYFTGIDFDLSRCLFIFSHNDHNKINSILKDRMYNIQVQGYNLKEKTIIAENYILPGALKELNLFEKVSIPKDIVKYIIENHTYGEPGVREMKRSIMTIASKINLLRFYNDSKAIPFAIPGFQLPFTCTKDHIDIFLKKKNIVDPSIAHLYI